METFAPGPQLLDVLSFLKSALASLDSLFAWSVDSDGWADAPGCCITHPLTYTTSTTSPSAPVQANDLLILFPCFRQASKAWLSCLQIYKHLRYFSNVCLKHLQF